MFQLSDFTKKLEASKSLSMGFWDKRTSGFWDKRTSGFGWVKVLFGGCLPIQLRLTGCRRSGQPNAISDHDNYNIDCYNGKLFSFFFNESLSKISMETCNLSR